MNALDPMDDLITVRRYLDPVRRRLPLVLVGCLLGAALGYGTSTRVTTSYTSKVAMLISPISSDPIDGVGTGAVEVDLETEAEVATSLVVADRVNEILGDEPPAKPAEDLLDQVDTAIKGTRVMELHFTARTPEIAQRGALAFSEAYLAYREDLANEQLAISTLRLEVRIDELQIELADVSSRKADIPESEQDSAVYAALDINEQTLLDELSLNQGRLADIRAVLTDDATIIDPPSLPDTPSSLGLPTLLLGGAAAGLVASLGLVFALEAARRGREANESIAASAPGSLRREPITMPGNIADDTVEPVRSPEMTEATIVAPEPEPAATDLTMSTDELGAHEGSQPEAAQPDESADPGVGSAASIEASERPSASSEPGLDRWSGGTELDEWDSAAAALARTADDSPIDPWTANDAWADTGSEPTDYPWATDTPTNDPWATTEPEPQPTDDPWATTEPTPTEDPVPIALVPATSISLAALLDDRARESVAQLRDHLAHAVDVDRRSIVVVDGGDGAATPVAVAVAVELAAAGRRVLLVDTDDAGRGVGARLGLADAPGLAEAIRRGGDLEGLPFGVVGQADLRVLCHGNELPAALADEGSMPAIDRIVAETDSTVVFACGLASTAMPLVAGGSWIGATTIATTAMADPRAIPVDEYRVVQGSRHPLIGIVSIMPRAALPANRN